MSVEYGQCKAVLPGLIYQPRKCVAMRRRRNLTLKLISAGLIFLLLLRTGVFRMLLYSDENHRHVANDGSKNFLRQLVDVQDKLGTHGNLHSLADNCSIRHFQRALRVVGHKRAQCRRRTPAESSCRIATDLFQLQSIGRDNSGCQHQDRQDFCTLQTNQKKHTVSCDRNTCDGQFGLITLNITTGILDWHRFVNIDKLELAINIILVHPNAGFCYVLCLYPAAPLDDFLDGGLLFDIEAYGVTQILNLPPVVNANNRSSLYSHASRSTRPINLNLILVDSVSRQHFFRSLPQTVKLLDSMLNSTEPYQFQSKSPVVLDFELFQAVRSRTFESLQVLFSGYINPFEKTFGSLAMPPTPLNIGKLLKPLKMIGYKTLWLEDLCYLWEWGMSKDLLVHNKKFSRQETWSKLRHALQNASIDSMGISPASCEILQTNGVNDPFHGPANLCFNGRHEHEYFLEYLQMYQRHLDVNYQPYFTFMETNIGHEDTGIRIQALDRDLAKYLKSLQDDKNTLTILFSDHGNAYGKFVAKSDEGTLETFHPFLFMIVPKNVQELIGEQKMLSLIQNQQRLVSLLDVHYMLASVIDITHSVNTRDQTNTHLHPRNISTVTQFNKQFNVSQLGLLGNVSQSRSCTVVPRIMPSLCICEGYENSPVLNKYYKNMAVHAVKELNKEIQRQHQQGNGDSSRLARCKPLMLTDVTDIKESRNKDGSKSVKMEVNVHTKKKITSSDSATFLIALHVPSTDSQGRQPESQNLKPANGRLPSIVRFERTTPYSNFNVCADPNVDLQLCICDLKLVAKAGNN